MTDTEFETSHVWTTLGQAGSEELARLVRAAEAEHERDPQGYLLARKPL
ncbi:hypothetical protein [Streptomyces sp. NPDC047079]